LAQFRETRAYHPLTELLALPDELPGRLFGDSIAGGMGRVLASLYDGDEAPLRRLIEDPGVDAYVRGAAALDTHGVLIANGLIDAAEVEDYWTELLESKLPRNDDFVRSALCLKAGTLGFVRALPAIRRAFDEELCDPGYCSLEDVEELLGSDGPCNSGSENDQGLVDDTIAELEWWSCFNRDPRPRRKPQRPLPLARPAPARKQAPEPAPGRNDPCPCGSGKKYKKCCGNEAAVTNAKWAARKEALAGVLHLQIELAGSDPLIWRELLVPGTFTLAELHLAIQDVMPWNNDHGRVFSQQDAEIDFPSSKTPFDSLTEEGAIFLHEFIDSRHPLFYTYDLGDDWEHMVTVTLWKGDAGVVGLPACIGGERAAPPEDIGGVWRYNQIVAAFDDGDDSLDQETREWLGDDFDPGRFSTAEADAALARLKALYRKDS
jgi:hypothetical protein